VRAWSVKDVPEKWKQTYCPPWKGGVWQNDQSWKPTDREAMYHQIIAANGDAEKIDAIIGNDTWTSFQCIECEKRKTVGVTFDNGDGGEITICRECLVEAAIL
jgi:hypothetical protein